MADIVRDVDVGRSVGVATTVTIRGSVVCVDDTSGSVKCEGCVVRGRAVSMLTDTFLRAGPLDELTNN